MTSAIVNGLTALPDAAFRKIMANPPRGIRPYDLITAKRLREEREWIAKRHDDDDREDFRQEGPFDVVRKVQRAVEDQTTITEAIDAVARKRGISRADAATAIAYHPEVVERVRLEREIATATQNRDDARDLESGLMIHKAGSTRGAADKLDATVRAVMTKHGMSYDKAYDHVLKTPEGKRLLNDDRRSRGIPTMPQDDDEDDVGKANNTLPRDTARRAHNGPGDDNEVMSADEVLQMLADQQQKKNPAMSRADAISFAASSREFSEAHRREQFAKFAHA